MHTHTLSDTNRWRLLSATNDVSSSVVIVGYIVNEIIAYIFGTWVQIPESSIAAILFETRITNLGITIWTAIYNSPDTLGYTGGWLSNWRGWGSRWSKTGWCRCRSRGRRWLSLSWRYINIYNALIWNKLNFKFYLLMKLVSKFCPLGSRNVDSGGRRVAGARV